MLYSLKSLPHSRILSSALVHQPLSIKPIVDPNSHDFGFPLLVISGNHLKCRTCSFNRTTYDILAIKVSTGFRIFEMDKLWRPKFDPGFHYQLPKESFVLRPNPAWTWTFNFQLREAGLESFATLILAATALFLPNLSQLIAETCSTLPTFKRYYLSNIET